MSTFEVVNIILNWLLRTGSFFWGGIVILVCVLKFLCFLRSSPTPKRTHAYNPTKYWNHLQSLIFYFFSLFLNFLYLFFFYLHRLDDFLCLWSFSFLYFFLLLYFCVFLCLNSSALFSVVKDQNINLHFFFTLVKNYGLYLSL